MPSTERAGATLHFTVDDLTPPWVAAPETILFHHGVGTTGGIWSEWVSELAGAFRCVRLDVRGNGQSSVPDPDHDWRMDEIVADAIAVADAAGAERFHLVGESLGGTTTYCTALAHPDRLLSITAICAGHRGGDIRQVDQWRAEMATDGMQAWSDRMMDHRFVDGAVTADQWQWFHDVQSASAPHAAVGLGEMLMNQRITDRLAGIDLPTLILHPDASPFLPVEVPTEAHALIKDSELHIFENAKHGIAFSHARESAGLLKDFIARRCR